MPRPDSNAPAHEERMSLAPLEVQSAPAMVAARLREGIFARRFPPHTQLNEVELARELSVSRGPLREAFSRLAHEGLLRRERNRGVFVVALDDASIRDVYFAREVVETAAAARLAAVGEGPALSGLDAVVDRLARTVVGAAEWPELVALDLEFHTELVRAAGSERLVRAFEPLAAETRLCLTYLESHYNDRRSLLKEHRDILAALRAGDINGSTSLIRHHMTESAAKLTASTKGA